MSSYINFFIRKDINEKPYFIPLGSFSRSHIIYQTCEEAPYEKISPLTHSRIEDCIAALVEDKDYYKQKIEDTKYTIEHSVPSFTDSPVDKIETIRELQSEIRGYQSNIDDIQFAIDYFRTLQEIIYDNSEGVNELDPNILYYGIEISEPTKENMI